MVHWRIQDVERLANLSLHVHRPRRADFGVLKTGVKSAKIATEWGCWEGKSGGERVGGGLGEGCKRSKVVWEQGE